MNEDKIKNLIDNLAENKDKEEVKLETIMESEESVIDNLLIPIIKQPGD
jgi:hypothetical protein